MRSILLLLALAALSPCHAIAEQPIGVGKITKADFPWWRGADRDGQASADQVLPASWSNSENVLWKFALPGRGHGSATILGDRVLITAADTESDAQYVLCLNRNTGKQDWKTAVHTGGLKTKGNRKQNKKASLASTTIATDGDHLFVTFVNQEAIWISALDLAGDIVWQKEVSKYVVHQGYGASPALYENLVIVAADNKGGGVIAAYQRSNGEQVWKHKRPKKPNYSSPIIVNVAGKQQLILTGCDLVTSLNPSTGKLNWEIDGATTECVTSTVTDGKHIFTSGGYPKNHIAAVAADGSGKVVWENGTRAYVPSLLYRDGHLFAVLDAGVAVCFSCADGSEVWKSRLGGTFSGSPVMVGDSIYAVNESGDWYVFKANVKKFQLVKKTKLGDSVFSTPTICGSRIYSRVAMDENGKRQEYLYCIGE